MVPADRIVAAVHSYWAAALPSDLVTLYPGVRLDTSGLQHWCELWVDAWSDPPRRAVAPDRLRIAIIVHCFSRHPTQKAGVHRIASLAREALAGRTLPVAPSEAITGDLWGCLRIREHAAHDLTRNQAASGQERLQHLVLTFDAIVEQTPSDSA